MPVVVGPKQPSKKRNTKSKTNVGINQPIGKMLIPGGEVVKSTAKAAQVNAIDQDDVTRPIVDGEATISDPHVEGRTVDPELQRQISNSADYLALED